MRVRFQRLVAILLIGLCYLSLSASSTKAQTPAPLPSVGEAIRIGTYNAQYLPLIPGVDATENGCCEDMPNRIDRLAERIIASGYDVIALEEMWFYGGTVFGQHPANEALAARLKAVYPYYVERVGAGPGILPPEHSGLMLFSKFEFQTLPQRTYQASRGDLAAYTPDGPWRDVAFVEYSRCTGDNCLANKGAALVRVKHPVSDRVYTIVFTHLDAGGDDTIRVSQLQQVEQLILGTLGDELAAREDIFFLGDLNINGNLRARQPQGCNEWEKVFGPFRENCSAPLNFFRDTLHDAWEYETQPDLDPAYRDLGLTGGIHNTNQSRLDYLFRSRPNSTSENRLCVQHMTLAYNLRHGRPYAPTGFGEAGYQDLSDHYGVNADINQWAPQCSPAEALVNPAFDAWHGGRIAHPSGMQWFRIENPSEPGSRPYVPGTFAIELRGSGAAEFRVYHSDDLSTPLPAYSDTVSTSTARVYHFPDGPFYIQVFSQDRTWTGDYEIRIHRLTGLSTTEAIVLYPNRPISYTFADLTANELWFQVNTEAPDSGLEQQLRFFVATDPVGGQLAFDLRDADGTTLIAQPNTGETELWRSNLRDNNRQMYMVVRRLDPSSTPSFSVGWETNLSVLHGLPYKPLKIKCAEQTSDETGIGEDDDNVRITITVDDTVQIIRSVKLGDFDEGQIRGLGDVIGAIRYTKKVHIHLDEEDGGLHFGTDYMNADIGPLAIDQSGPNLGITDVNGDGGHYPVFYALSHGGHGLQITYPSVAPTVVVHKRRLTDTRAVQRGDRVTFEVQVTNAGATDLVSLPADDFFDDSYLAYDSSSLPPNAVLHNRLRWNDLTGPTPSGITRSLGRGQSFFFTTTFRVIGCPPNQVTLNSFEMSQATDADGNIAPRAASDAPVRIACPAVTVTKQLAAPACGYFGIGQSMPFTVTVTNTGNTRLDSLPLTDSFDPSIMAFSSATLTPNTASDGLLTWTDLTAGSPNGIDRDLDPGQSLTLNLTFTALASTSFLSPPQAVNRIRVEGAKDEYGFAPAGAEATTSTTIQDADLFIETTQQTRFPTIRVNEAVENTLGMSPFGTTHSNQVAVPGEVITYTVSFVNRGPDEATYLRIQDVIPSGTVYVGHNFTPCLNRDIRQACYVGRLGPGETRSFEVYVRVPRVTEAGFSTPPGTNLTNAVQIASGFSAEGPRCGIPDRNATNNAATFRSTVLGDFGDAPETEFGNITLGNPVPGYGAQVRGAYNGNYIHEWLGRAVSGERGASDTADIDGEANLAPFNTDHHDDGVLFRNPFDFSLPDTQRGYLPSRSTKVQTTLSVADPTSGRYSMEANKQLYVTAWIDSNRNGQFGDLAEELLFKWHGAPGISGSDNLRWPSGQSYYVLNQSVTMPGQAGWMMVRVRLSYGVEPTPGGALDYGETEDYLIGIYPSTPRNVPGPAQPRPPTLP